MKIHPVEGELFHADDGQAYKKQIVAFGNFANAPKTNIYKFKRKRTPVTETVSYEFTENVTDIMPFFSDNFLLTLI
jgi:hypothetical protein